MMEEKIANAAVKKDREVQEAESSSAASNRNLSQLQTSLNIAKRTLKDKADELVRLEKQVRDGLAESGKDTVAEAINEAETELKIIRE
jgi:DNA repair protein RAD50